METNTAEARASSPQTQKKTHVFEDLIKAWVTATNNSKRLARQIAEEALKHFFEHGDVSRCQLFLEAIDKHGKNYIRKAAYLKWLQAFSPISMEDGKFVKDKAREFDPKLLEEAMKQPFWDFAPDPENVSFTNTDVVKALQSTLARYRKQRYIPADDEAADVVVRAEQAVAALSRPVVAKAAAA